MILAHLQWGPDPEIINLFGLSIRYYGVLFLSGILLSLYVLRGIFKKENLPLENLDTLTTYGVIGILAGARLGHCLFYEPAYYLANPLEMFFPISITDEGIKFIGYQGLASHGGGIGIITALYLYTRKTGESMIKLIDLIAVVTALTGAFIRLANFMNSEIIGIPTTKSWGVVFERVDALPRHPAQLYEAFSYFMIFGIMFYLYSSYREKLQNGFFFGLLIVLIFIARFIIEVVKESPIVFELGIALKMGQVLSIPYILVGLGFMIYGLKTTNKLAVQKSST
jgi:prolipoprotein diacylglyceryl transferase